MLKEAESLPRQTSILLLIALIAFQAQNVLAQGTGTVASSAEQRAVFAAQGPDTGAWSQEAAAPSSVSPDALKARIDRIMERPEFRHALFGIEFYSLDKGQALYKLNADKLFTPGSTTKLLTEGTALELLGGDFRFHTRVYRTGTIAPDGTLYGDLVLVASGDPNLSGRIKPDGTLAFENEDHSYDGDPNTRAVPGDPMLVIRQLAQQVAAQHVKRILGHVFVDVSLFPEGDRELGTGVAISPVVVNDNLIDLTIGPGASEGAPAVLQQSPATSYASFINQVTTGKPDSKPAIRFASDVKSPDGAHRVTIVGSFPAGKPPILYKYRVPEPSRFAETVLIEALREQGISVDPRASGANPDLKALALSYVSDHLVAEHVSPPLKEEIKVTLKVSQNLHASSTPLILSAVLSPNDKTKTGFDLEREFLARAGLDLTGAQQGDGAGGNAHFTPEFMTSFLAYMARQKDYQDFLKALPILGRDGTLVEIQPTSPAAGHVFAKTGTYAVGDPLNRSLLVTGKGLAGYMTTAGGQHLAFAIYVNNVSVPSEPDAINRIIGQALGEIAAAAFETAP
jgi:D-alanyl-D-alanine carboxypeptidase/D-alanyl-D-alanine-endopeptidase (penicillin-binding protein 4)